MALMTPAGMGIAPSRTQVGRADVTLLYTVVFDAFDQASNQLYHEHVDLFGVDANEPAEDGTSRIWWIGLNDIQSSMSNNGVMFRAHTFDVPLSALNEDPSPEHPDEIMARVSLTPVGHAPQAVTRDSNVVTLTLG